MVAEVKQMYRGVLCTHCRLPIPLSPSAARKETRLGEQQKSGVDEFVVHSFALRCRVCHGEGLYTPSDVIDCQGTPRTRGAQSRKSRLNPDSGGHSHAAKA